MALIRSKMFWIILIVVIIAVATGVGIWRSWGIDHTPGFVRFGVSYDPYYANSLDLNPFTTFDAILAELKVKRVRLSARWDIAEPNPGEYNWDQTDLFVAKASQANASIILAIGAKLPRWPECYRPTWATKLTAEEYRAAVLEFVEESVRHFQANTTIIAWQVENEPLVNWFGDCPKPDPKLVKEEIALVKKLDPRPVLVTDSGEMSMWYPAAKLGGDWFGTTLYRVVKDQ
ncbi:MAG: beta-galactosidase, partial [Patescibacteria group bacterium]